MYGEYFMKMIALTALALFSSTLWARPNTVDFTCTEVKEMVKDNGTFILSHGDQALYSRFVKNSMYCDSGERSISAYALTLDEKKCNVGFVCADRDSGSATFIAPSKITVCREGTRQAFTVRDSINDHNRTEVRTCENGRWYPKAPAPKIIKCKDGRRFSGVEYLYDRNGHFNVTRECKNGKYHIIRATPANGSSR